MGTLNVASLLISVALVSAILTRVAMRLQVLDVPNHRSSHREPVPRLGGLAIIGGTFLGLIGLGLADVDLPVGDAGGTALCGATLVVAAVGFADDVWRWPIWTKFLGQLMGTIILLGSGVVIERLSLPWLGEFDLGFAGYLFTAAWLIGLANAFNFMDGLNGIAGGTAAVAAFAFSLLALDQGATGVGVVALALAGALLGFLPFNFPVARIFMGDVGSQFVGFALAGLAVLAAEPDGPRLPFLVMPLLLLIFIWDVVFTFGRRLVRGEPVWKSHRSHLYQLLSRSLGSDHVRVSLLHYAMAVLQAGVAWYLVKGDPGGLPIVIGGIVGLLAIYTIWVVTYAEAQGVRFRSP